ncbi:branched-chain amino acid ABC transporter permease [Afifella sp. IM 167]|uniref:branched-chain amino acid ABC transporter permease n=1 Tax=Afifella sp. IM 167 TaxID=2033586 RepID=UPI001CCD1542|nr:branched-chain amino acid ABC transporter permease [Afifella sp. IM 167]MBZ8134483.1 branched-chain amino acid ABC transporter permease [Afifella sp. IM 167]
MLAQTIVNGLLLGGVYGIATIGFSVVWGVMGIINLAHGAYIMVGAYIAFALNQWFGLDPFLAMPFAMVALFVIGYALQAFLLNPVMHTSLLLTLVVTFGIDLFLIDLFVLFFSSDVRAVHTAYSGSSLEIGPVLISWVRLVAAILSVLVAIASYLFLNRTRTGQAILATALDREAARLMGIYPDRAYGLTAGLAAAVAGAAGCLASTIFPISPTLGISFLGAVFVVTVLGGIGSVAGVIIAGFAYALVQAFAATYLGANYQQIVAFSMFLLILIVRPQGLFGKPFYGES